jgi:hypothetical protein
MTTAGQQEGGDDTVQIKRVRMDHAELPSSSNDQQRLTTAAGSAAADVSLVAVPLVGDQMAGSDLVPALQQLLSVYQVSSCIDTLSGQRVLAPLAPLPAEANSSCCRTCHVICAGGILGASGCRSSSASYWRQRWQKHAAAVAGISSCQQ